MVGSPYNRSHKGTQFKGIDIKTMSNIKVLIFKYKVKAEVEVKIKN